MKDIKDKDIICIFSEIESLSISEKERLLDDAKEAYYNTGEPLMTDQVYDELEASLGKENISYIGAHHSENYTVKHPCLMGSLSKVQVKYEDRARTTINWNEICQKILGYISKAKSTNPRVEITPKYDGCSFEIVFDNKSNFISGSTRGDGSWGKDIKHIIFANFVSKAAYWDKAALVEFCSKANDDEYAVIRGEILIELPLFESKYSEKFTNPRSFISGLVGADYDKDDYEQSVMLSDIDLVCYDYRIVSKKTGKYKELALSLKLPGKIPSYMCGNILASDLRNPEKFQQIYKGFDHLRNHEIHYALDGFVIKPMADIRICDPESARPADCVAVKFLPEITTTWIEDISWKLGKTGEYFPTAIYKKVILGEKEVTRCSLFNYNYLVENKVGIGSEIEISLAGDIIPFCYSVMSHSDNYNLPSDAKVTTLENIAGEQSSNLHLMKQMTAEDASRMAFLASVAALEITGIGPKTAEALFDTFKGWNILFCMSDAMLTEIGNVFGIEKLSTRNIVKALKSRRETLKLNDIIRSMSIAHCGKKTSEVVANHIMGLSNDFTGVSSDVIAWATNPDSHERTYIEVLVKTVGYDIDAEKASIIASQQDNNSNSKIPVIMTGDTSNTSYATKKAWLAAHPQYTETSKWTECKILFTNDLNSASSKMKKAQKLGIEIRLYEA